MAKTPKLKPLLVPLPADADVWLPPQKAFVQWLQTKGIPQTVPAMRTFTVAMIEAFATAAGLEILTRDGRWLAVEAPPGHIVVDTGDMMQLITNGRLPAITHRVVNPPSGAEDVVRYSMPFFVHPFPTCPLAPLPFCVSESDPARYEATTAQGYLEKRLAELGLR